MLLVPTMLIAVLDHPERASRDLSSIERDPLEVSITVDHEEYPQGSGKWTAKVGFINSGDGFAMKSKMDPRAAKIFAATMKAKAAAIPVAPRPSKSSTPPPHDHVGDEPAVDTKADPV